MPKWKMFHIFFWPRGRPMNGILWHLWLIFSRCIFVAAFIIISFISIYIQFLIQTIIIFMCLKIKVLVDCIVRITKVLLLSLSLAFFTYLRNFFHRKASKNVFLLIRSTRHFPGFSRGHFYGKGEIEKFRKIRKFDGIGWFGLKWKLILCMSQFGTLQYSGELSFLVTCNGMESCLRAQWNFSGVKLLKT